MPANGNDLYRQLDEAADTIGRAFSETAPINPQLRYLLYSFLLRFNNLEPLGHDFESIRSFFNEALTPESYTRLEERVRRLRELLAPHFAPSYMVANYWSPIDGRRRSMVMRPSPSATDRLKIVAEAYAFYALTYAGEEQTDKLWSMVHYASIRAPRKRGILVHYQDAAESGPEDEGLLVPQAIQDSLLDKLGITDSISNVLLNGRIAEVDLADALYRVLSNSPGDHWPDIADFASLTIGAFRKRAKSLPKDLQTYTQKALAYLSSLFDGKGLTEEQACFMVATHLLWRRVCPAQFMYGFPAYVGNTCCILTMGTDEPLSSDLRIALSDLTYNLFVHPLFLDHPVRHARSVLHEGRTPVATLSRQCVLAKRELDTTTDPATLRQQLSTRFDIIAAQAGVLSSLFERYAGFATHGRGTLTTQPIEEFIRLAYAPFQERAKKLGVTVSLPAGQNPITADAGDMQAVFHNLFGNALYWLERGHEGSREISVQVLRAEGGEIEVLFADSGPGIPDNARESVFRPYFSLKAEGGGVGLSIVTDIVREYDGTVELIPPGVLPGAHFRILLRDRTSSTGGQA